VSKIGENTKLVEIIRNEKMRKILEKHGIPCVGCPFFVFEAERLTLKEVCEVYKVDTEKLIKELNKTAKLK